MSEFFQVAKWKPGPLLPPRDARDGALVFVVAVLCFLAVLDRKSSRLTPVT